VTIILERCGIKIRIDVNIEIGMTIVTTDVMTGGMMSGIDGKGIAAVITGWELFAISECSLCKL